MNIKFISKDLFVIKTIINDKMEINEKCKQLLKNIRKKYIYDIYGTYNVEVYYVNDFITIYVFRKIEEETFNYNCININIIKKKNNIPIIFKDYELVKEYKSLILSPSKIKDKDILRLCEHYIVDTSIYNENNL